MNIQVDIGHPAHVHYLKNFFKIMKGRGHHFLVSSRNRSPAPELLRSYEIDFLDRGKGAENMVGKILNLPKINYFIYRNAIKHKTDLFVGFMNPYLAHVAHFLKKPSIIFEDTDNASMNHRLYSGFASTICSPSAFKKDFGKKHIKFNGYLELAYLHPNYFSPDLSVLELLGVKKGEKYAILRFVKWNANHDLGHTGITPRTRLRQFRSLRNMPGFLFLVSLSCLKS